ncbi:MAG: SPOR domain-containing protein [Pseudomonadota bacterium]
MADASMNGRGFAPQAGSVHAYQAYQAHAEQQQVAQSHGGAMRAGTALAGATLSLALVIGVSVWGYQLMARDVAGVPVVRAVQGEMRVRPDNPGGQQADNQGFAVNEVAAAGSTAAPADQIVLAPEPIDLSDETTPLIDQLAAAQPRYAGQEGEVAARQASTELSPEMASIQALADQIAAGATPLTGIGETASAPVQTAVTQPAEAAPPEPTAQATPAVPEQPQMAIIDTSTPGVARSLRPSLRPAEFKTASLGAFDAGASATAVRDVDPATIPAGTRLVQLGAYESPEIARKEWDRFAARFADYMTGKDRVVQRAQSGGRTFYRLRAIGFTDLADARRFCAALTAQNTDCIPVVTR